MKIKEILYQIFELNSADKYILNNLVFRTVSIKVGDMLIFSLFYNIGF